MTGDRPIRSPFFPHETTTTESSRTISRQIRGPNPVWTRQIMDTTDRPVEVRIPAEDEQRASGCNYHIRSGLVFRKRNDVRDGMPSTDESLTALFHPTIYYIFPESNTVTCLIKCSRFNGDVAKTVTKIYRHVSCTDHILTYHMRPGFLQSNLRVDQLKWAPYNLDIYPRRDSSPLLVGTTI
jgi:hypothetical protein